MHQIPGDSTEIVETNVFTCFEIESGGIPATKHET